MLSSLAAGLRQLSIFVVISFILPAFASLLQVDTTIGKVYGIINGTHPDVLQYLGIPFAESPIADLRWEAPVPKSPMRKVDATRFGPDCAQYLSTVPSAYNVDTQEFNIVGPISEDCLTLSVWAPLSSDSLANSTCRKLPVVVWLFGGDQQFGGSQVPYQQPASWVQRSQEHLVVQVKSV